MPNTRAVREYAERLAQLHRIVNDEEIRRQRRFAENGESSMAQDELASETFNNRIEPHFRTRFWEYAGIRPQSGEEKFDEMIDDVTVRLKTGQ